MSIDIDLVEILMENNQKNHPPKYLLYLNCKPYQITDVSIVKSTMPVNEPTTRGGVYFSDRSAYKIKGVIHDTFVVPLLTKKMLGPNTEFVELKILAQTQHNEKQLHVEIFTNLTNSIQTPTFVELGMTILRLK